MATSSGDTRQLSPTIEALRAIAVTLVVLFHLWPERVTGGFVGVDVFFAISGYLISGHLLREREVTGHVRLLAFWARRVRRLLPAALVVLLATLCATVLFVPMARWGRLIVDLWASLGLVQNWHLAADSVNYFEVGNSPTALQHFWSLSVEEQFYLVWPVIVVLLGVVALRRSTTSHRALVGRAAIVVGIASLAWSIYQSISSPAVAYFSTLTHAWEFAAGAGLAVLAPAISRVAARMTSRVRTTVGAVALVLGVAAILASGMRFTGSLAFPGWIAVIPIGGAILAIATLSFTEGSRIDRIVGIRPIRLLGATSYSNYLWHWPLIVIVPFVLDHPLGTVDKVVILGASIALAWLTKRFVEDPVRFGALARTGARRTLAIGAAAALCAAAIGIAPHVTFDTTKARVTQLAHTEFAKALDATDPCFASHAALQASPSICPDSHVLDPSSLEIARWSSVIDAEPTAEDRAWTTSWTRCPSSTTADPRPSCTFGPKDAPFTIAVVGDSHGFQWAYAILPIAKKYNWRVTITWFAGCELSVPSDKDDTCAEWQRATLDELAANDGNDLIVTSAFSRSFQYHDRQSRAPAAQERYRAALEELVDAQRHVLVIGDAPLGVSNIPECISATTQTVDPCTSPRAVADEVDPLEDAALSIESPLLQFFDVDDVFCDETTCHAVIGGITAYRDRHHISPPFLRSLGTLIEPILTAAAART
jgi:peptidoglycan/LPS O-acetylase OafA/YrhL